MSKKIYPNAGGRLWLDILYDVAGGLIYSVGTQCFSAPNHIAPGGVGGASILINYLTGLPISLLVLAINIPLLVMAWAFMGREFAARTVKSVVILTVMLELVGRSGIVYQGETMLAAVYGGVVSGCGLALVFMRGSTTGGTDILARLLQMKLPGVPVGQSLLLIDSCVMLAAAVVYRNVESALFALISSFACARVIDSILYGLDMGKVLMIVTSYDFYKEIAGRINKELGRGCTLIDGRGVYTDTERPVLLCAVRRSQLYEVKRIVYQADPSAFIMAMEANEVIGEGFKQAGAGER